MARAPPSSRSRSASPARGTRRSVERMADRRAHRDARDRRPPGSVAGARRVPRSAMGPDRRDVRRGPAPRRDDGQRVRARPSGRIARRRGRGHREALRRLRGLAGRSQLGAGAHPRPRAARGLPPPVRGGRADGRSAIGDERLQRARRDPVRRIARAADGHPPRRVGLRRLRRRRLLLGAPAQELPPPRGRRHRGGVGGVGGGARCRAPDDRLLRRAAGRRRRRRNRRRRDRSTAPSSGCCGPSSSSACSSARSSTSRGRRGRRRRAGASSSRASLASQSIVLLRNDGTLPIDPTTTAAIAVIGPNADDPRNLFGDYSYAAHVESLLEMRDVRQRLPRPDSRRLRSRRRHRR